MASNKVSVVLTFEMTRPYKEAERRVDAMFELPGQFQQLLDWLTSHGFKEVKPVKTDKERQYVFLATIFHPYWTLFKQKKDDRPLLSFGPTDLEADLGKFGFALVSAVEGVVQPFEDRLTSEIARLTKDFNERLAAGLAKRDAEIAMLKQHLAERDAEIALLKAEIRGLKHARGVAEPPEPKEQEEPK